MIHNSVYPRHKILHAKHALNMLVHASIDDLYCMITSLLNFSCVLFVSLLGSICKLCYCTLVIFYWHCAQLRSFSVLCFPMSSSNVCSRLKMLQVCMTILTMSTTTLMKTFLKRLKNGDFNLNPGDDTLAWPLSEIHFKAYLWPFIRQGTERINDAMLTSKLQRMDSGLRLCKCHVDRELSQMLFA